MTAFRPGRPEWIGMGVAWTTLLLTLLLATAAPDARAEPSPAESGRPANTSWIQPQLRAERAAAARAWVRVGAALRSDDAEAATAAWQGYIRDLAQMGQDPDAPSLWAASSAARRWASRNRPGDARSLHNLLHHSDPTPSTALSALEASGTEWSSPGTWISEWRTAWIRSWRFAPIARVLTAQILFSLLAAWMAASFLVAVGLALRHGPLWGADSVRRPRSLVRAAPALLLATAFGVAVAAAAGSNWSPHGAWPYALGLGAVAVFGATAPYLTWRERVVATICSVGIAVSPWVNASAESHHHRVDAEGSRAAWNCGRGACSERDALWVAESAAHGEPSALLATALVASRAMLSGRLDLDTGRAWVSRAVRHSSRPASALVAAANERLVEWSRGCTEHAEEATRALGVAEGLYASALEAEPNLAEAKWSLAIIRARQGRDAEANALRQEAIEKNPDLHDLDGRRSSLVESGGCDPHLDAMWQLAWVPPRYDDVRHATGPTIRSAEVPLPNVTTSVGAGVAVLALLMAPWYGPRLRASWRCVECGQSRAGSPAAMLAMGPSCIQCINDRRFATWRGKNAEDRAEHRRTAAKRSQVRWARAAGWVLPPTGLAALGHTAWSLALGLLSVFALLLAWQGPNLAASQYSPVSPAALFAPTLWIAAAAWAVGWVLNVTLRDRLSPRRSR